MSYQALRQQFSKINNLNHLAAICGWDQQTQMPTGGAESRARAMAELSVLLHEQMTQPQLADWFEAASQESLTQGEQASLAEMKRQWQQANLLPSDLVSAKSIAGSRCEHAWRTQRGANDWQGFLANFKEVVNLSRQEAQIRSEATGVRPYEAMMDLYEPGMTCDKLDQVFDDLKSWLPQLTQQILEQQKSSSLILPQGSFPTSHQEQLGRDVMQLLGFDFDRGRLDISMHPFCGGVPDDVRITTRYDESDFVQSLMGIIHETGHARYEQGLPGESKHLPVGQARSMGIHESQSLLFEMQIGRSPAFLERISPRIQKHFGEQPAFELSNLKALYGKVEPGYIRVDADEVTYPAHVILRYEIERDLIEGKIDAADIPELWDQKMQAALGLSTKGNYTNGCMQDVHWTDGSFGYFPSYTLGAMYAAQFMAAIKRSIDVDAAVRSEDLSPVFNWLEQQIWSRGSTLSTSDLVTAATGEALNPDYFQAHLKARYLGQ